MRPHERFAETIEKTGNPDATVVALECYRKHPCAVPTAPLTLAQLTFDHDDIWTSRHGRN
eukprot:CAMPEP_0180671886 /NCGR_PEP_ID=MMETSP1037_2-20121125/64829_1 /TAXON_ID=632150 /ORGANISM="Azadinium spinosum, Strain 3D9" /LENGTH=59 /DNA_ID=CAMNT_0022700975 /DNA_START=141 /DNA_END=317 /DNA_ORIENTATION=+